MGGRPPPNAGLGLFNGKVLHFDADFGLTLGDQGQTMFSRMLLK